MAIKFIQRYFYQNYTNILLPFPPFNACYQTGHVVEEMPKLSGLVTLLPYGFGKELHYVCI